MFGWLVDHAVVFYVLLGFVAVLMLVLWWQNRKRNYLIVLGVVVLLAAVVWLLTLFVVSDQQIVVGTIDKMAVDLEKRRVNDFFQNVSKSFKHGSMDRKAFQEYVERSLKAYKVTTFHVSKFEVTKLVPRDRAEANFRIQVEGIWENPPPPMRCDAEFVWENERWCLKGFGLFFANTKNEFHLPP